MIKTARQYQNTQKHLKEFQAAHAALEKTDNVDPLLKELQLNAHASMIESLQGQLDEYDRLRTGGLKEIQPTSLHDLPKVLIQLRIAKGWTQKQLAQALGMKEQQIQRYESHDYQSTSLARVFEILDVLGAPVNLNRIRLPKTFLDQTSESSKGKQAS